MKKKLLTFEDLENFYSTHKKSFHFCAENEDEAVVVQVPGKVIFSEEEYDEKMGLTPVHLQSCHLFRNRNRSSISEESMKACMKSIHNRPILGYIHKVENENGEFSYEFAGHEMHLETNEETGEEELVYDEIAVGVIPESCNEKLVYDEEKKKTYLEVDGYLFDEYTRASDILKEKGECSVSVELALLDYSYSAKDKSLQINKFVFTGVTILGRTRSEDETYESTKEVEPGMYGSNIKLKDFKQNNSLFTSISEDENSKLIETLERLNTTLSSLNIDNKNMEGGLKVENFEEEVKDETVEGVAEENTEETTEETPEVTETEAKDDDDETKDTEAKKKRCEEETFEEESESTESTETAESEETTEEVSTETEKFSKTFEVSHEDIRASLYALLAPYEEANNDCYWINKVFDTYFVYQGWKGEYHGQKYTVNTEGAVSFDGEPYALYAEFVTKEEQSKLEEMRANYSSIVTELNDYKEAEEMADKMTVFEDAAYASYLETEEFKALMSEDTVKKFSKEELVEKADATLGKLVKTQGTFAYKETKEEVKAKPSFFAYAKRETESSFLDGLLKK